MPATLLPDGCGGPTHRQPLSARQAGIRSVPTRAQWASKRVKPACSSCTVTIPRPNDRAFSCSSRSTFSLGRPKMTIDVSVMESPACRVSLAQLGGRSHQSAPMGARRVALGPPMAMETGTDGHLQCSRGTDRVLDHHRNRLGGHRPHHLIRHGSPGPQPLRMVVPGSGLRAKKATTCWLSVVADEGYPRLCSGAWPPRWCASPGPPSSWWVKPAECWARSS